MALPTEQCLRKPMQNECSNHTFRQFCQEKAMRTSGAMPKPLLTWQMISLTDVQLILGWLRCALNEQMRW